MGSDGERDRRDLMIYHMLRSVVFSFPPPCASPLLA